MSWEEVHLGQEQRWASGILISSPSFSRRPWLDRSQFHVLSHSLFSAVNINSSDHSISSQMVQQDVTRIHPIGNSFAGSYPLYIPTHVYRYSFISMFFCPMHESTLSTMTYFHYTCSSLNTVFRVNLLRNELRTTIRL